MKQMKRITLRLSLDNPSDKKIADFLANIDKNKYHIGELEKRISELTEKNRLLTEKYEAIPKIFRKN